MDRWSRRQVVQGAGVAGLGLLAGCGRLPGLGPKRAQLPRVGLLWAGSAQDRSRIDPFRAGLRELGWLEGQNIVLDYRIADGRSERIPGLTMELIGLPVDVVVTHGTQGIRAAMQATRTTPIVMAAAANAVGSGFVASLARPGGNVTGLSFLNRELSAKRLELLYRAVPHSSRVATLADAAQGTGAWAATEEAAHALQVELEIVQVPGVDGLESAFAAVQGAHVDAVNVLASELFVAHRQRIVDLVAGTGLPAMYENSDFVEAGGLMAYGAHIPALFHRAAYYVDRILKGTPPADLPVEQPREFEFVINLRTAQALGLTVPEHVLLQATEVIQ
jgi:putative ABC transport system substrate-binding protein